MADGIFVRDGAIAIDPRDIPLGSKIQINGKTYLAEDTGGAIKDYYSTKLNRKIFRVDIWFSACKQAIEWGRETVRMIVFKKA